MSREKRRKDERPLTEADKGDLQWPPRCADEMVAWQCRIGTDLEIARFLCLSRASIYGQRMKFSVPALPRKKRARVREKQPGAVLKHYEIARLYAGRRYEDRTSAPPLRQTGFLRETETAAYMIAAE